MEGEVSRLREDGQDLITRTGWRLEEEERGERRRPVVDKDRHEMRQYLGGSVFGETSTATEWGVHGEER